MIRPVFSLVFALGLWLPLAAQDLSLINAKKTVEEGKRLYDSSLYDLSEKEFLKIDYRDTGYVYAQSELVRVYLAQKKYGDMIAACTAGLEKPSPYRSVFLSYLGKAYAGQDNVEKAMAAFATGLKEFPFDFNMTYSVAMMYYQRKEYEKAAEFFFKTLYLAPYHSGSHFYLGRISILRGEKVHAMMATGIYLGINNTVNSELVMLENFLNNEVSDEGSVPSDGKNAFDRMDQIIRAKISVDDKFKSAMPVKVVAARQFELFFDQLPPADPSSADPWARFYLPVYAEIKKEKFEYAFLYHLLSSTKIEQVHQWSKKNEKTLLAFYAAINEALTQYRKVKVVPAEFGFSGPVSCWYDKNSRLESIGKFSDKTAKIGRWIYFDDNGVKLAEGDYDALGRKTGLWTYSGNDGTLHSVENYITGEMKTYYHNDGNFRQRYKLVNEKVEGPVEIYYPCGPLKEKTEYVAGNREGKAVVYFADGKTQSTYEYRSDSLQGKVTHYYPSGVLKSQQEFERGNQQGTYVAYYAGGKLRVKGAYDHDEATGRWQYFHANGVIHQLGEYKKDKAVGEWLYYSKDGQLTERRNYNDKEEYHGDDIGYSNGVKHYESVYENDKLVRLTYYDESGNVKSTAANPDGTFSIKGYLPGGQFRMESFYTKGKASGTWKYYYPWGALQSTYQYIDGRLEGPSEQYHESGILKSTSNYRKGEYDGYYKEYYANSKLKSQGWFTHGQRQQRWIFYYANGTIESDLYYLNGEPLGRSINYGVDGTVSSVVENRNDQIQSLNYYDSQGKPISTTTSKQALQMVETKFSSGLPARHIEILCGHYHNDVVRFLPGGKVFSTTSYKDGKREGKFRTTYITGAVDGEGQYTNDQAEGTWVWRYDNGKKYSVGNYALGERDSVWVFYHYNGNMSAQWEYRAGYRHGLSKIFSPEGTLVAEKKFADGDIIGYRVTGKDGKLGEWRSFDGNGVLTAYYPDGKKALEETYSHGLYDGTRRAYYANGKISYEYPYVNGQDEGEAKLYYANGKIRQIEIYRNDDRDGICEFYNEDGSLQRTEEYKLGFLHGTSRIYQNGKVVRELKFWSGEPSE